MKKKPVSVSIALFASVLSLAMPVFAVAPPAPPASLAAPDPGKTAQTGPASADTSVRARFDIDKIIQRAHEAKKQGRWSAAQQDMLSAAQQLKAKGFPNDQVKLLRDMTLEPVAGRPPEALQYVNAGRSELAKVYYQRYLQTKPRDAQWLLEALAWAAFANDAALAQSFPARVPDKAHENIEQRAQDRARELEQDDALTAVFDALRDRKNTGLAESLKKWPYPVDYHHSQEGVTLLHMAVWFNRADVARVLVENFHANVNVEDKEKDTPLDYAMHQGNNDMVTYLKSKGGKANHQYKPAAKTPVVNAPPPDIAQPKTRVKPAPPATVPPSKPHP